MKNILLGILSLAIIVAIVGCSDEPDPKFRIHNERADKANVQIQTSGGNTININDVEAGQTTAFQTAATGNIVAKAVLHNESVSPEVSFFAVKDTRYTIVIQSGIIPALRVDRE
ncbi:MAG: hypothetical protein M0Q21_06665 [Ignavibacteriaceae bacterium]|nr:hypothetical protein [Ignavibacteriaceae bacterium]